MAPLKVLISGGGIAGNALAFWLSKQGHDVTVIERFPKLRATGLQIDLRGRGIEVMRRMGLEEAFRAKSVKEQGLRIVDSSGRQMAFFPVNASGKGSQSFTTDFEIMRGDLCRLLYDATGDHVKYIYGTFIQNYKETDGSVEALFSNGKMDRFDLLVGADGQGSRTRKMMLNHDAPNPFHPLGVYIAYYTIPQHIESGDAYIATTYIAPGMRMLFTRRHDPRYIQAYLICKTDSERLKSSDKGDIEEEKEIMAEMFRDSGWKSEEMLKAMESSDDFYCERLGVVQLDSWSRGGVTLVGDAAYAPSATTGMGTTCGLVGAYILAGEIAKHCGQGSEKGVVGGSKAGLGAALKAYEDKLRPFMDHVQKGLLDGKTIWDWIPTTSWGIFTLHIFLALVNLLRLDIFASWLVSEEVNDWALPDYDEMVHGRGAD